MIIFVIPSIYLKPFALTVISFHAKHPNLVL